MVTKREQQIKFLYLTWIMKNDQSYEALPYVFIYYIY